MMDKMVLSTTTIDELYSMGLISTRTRNMLGINRISNVKLIFDYLYKGHKISDIRHIGKKAEYEINEVITAFFKTQYAYNGNRQNYNVEIPQLFHIPQEFHGLFSCLFEQYKGTYFLGFDSAWDFWFALENIDKLMSVKQDLTKKENIQYRNGILQFLDQLLKRLCGVSLPQSFSYAHYQRIKQNAEDIGLNFSDVDEFRFLTAERQQYLEREFEEMCSNHLSVRAQHLIQTNDCHCVDFIALFGKKLVDYYSKFCPNKNMDKTITELFNFNQRFKALFEKITFFEEDDFIAYRLKKHYPYLIGHQRQFVREFIQTHQHEPVFYLLYHYMRLTEKRNEKLRSLYYGIFDDTRRSLEDLAKTYGLTRERVRQIIATKKIGTEYPALPDGTLPERYSWILQQDVITEEHSDYKTLGERENLPDNFNAFACIVSMFTHLVVNDFKGKIVVFSQPLAETFSVKWLREQLESTLFAKYPKDTVVSIDSALADVPEKYHKQIRELFIYLTRQAYGMTVDDNGNVNISQNCIDIEYELVQILESKGEPLSGAELLERFKDKYPEHKYTEVSQIKPYILKSKRIGAIGNKSMYGLVSWTHIYFGSIIDLLVNTLRHSEIPMKFDDLYAIVLKTFPTSSARSIYSTMSGDKQNRFILFEEGRFGLTDKEYDDLYIPIPTEARARQSFMNRISNLRHFIDTYHRFPTATGGETEASLQRWLYNIQNKVVKLELEQVNILHTLLQSYEGKGYPKTSVEYDFLNNCNKYKDFINMNHSLPSNDNGRKLKQWFCRSKKKMNGFVDQRYNYMNSLLDYISALGFDA